MLNKNSLFWTYRKLETATGGNWFVSPAENLMNSPLHTISFDSRDIKPGDVFIAIQGVEKNGHEYIDTAIRNGASTVIASDLSFLQSVTIPTLIVKNTQVALESLGIYVRENISAQRIAITGSVGKTSTKDLLYHMLSSQALTWANKRSFNNLWGVPITLANMPADTKYGIFEIGTNHEGEIEPLTKQVTPDICLITTIGSAHLGNFPSFNHLLVEKVAIAKGLVPGGKIVLPKDHPNFKELSSLAIKNGASEIYTFGYHEKSNMRIIKDRPDLAGLVVKFSNSSLTLEKKIPLYGKHWAYNIAAALSIGYLLGANIKNMLESVSTFSEPQGRGKIYHLLVPSETTKKFLFVDQTYNSNPQSVAIAMETLGNIPARSTGRRIAILGDMTEVGNEKESLEYHAKLSDFIDTEKIHTLITIGAFSKALYNEIKNRPITCIHFNTNDHAIDFLKTYIEENDILMAKASNSLNFCEILQAFL